MKSAPHLHLDYIDPEALQIVNTLQRSGFVAYLVGGCVRDLLLNIHPKDFDIATNAKPSNVKRLVSMAFVIGKRFRLVLVKRGQKQFEVATFRRDPTPEEESQEGFFGDNLFGSLEEDARRRDFTINSLFFDPINGDLIDHCGGQKDLDESYIRTIGNPEKRLKEDPIRSLRALRLAHKLGFSIEPSLRQAMAKQADDLPRSVLPRRREEMLKILRLKDPGLALQEAFDLEILTHFVPSLCPVYEGMESCDMFRHLLSLLSQDAEVDFALRETPGFLFGELLYATARALDLSLFSLKSSERFQTMMRLELGMFKQEQQLVLKAFEILHVFERTSSVKKRGVRRQRAIVLHEAFPLAFHLARVDHLLSPDDLFFWWKVWWGIKSEAQLGELATKASQADTMEAASRP